ncbi:translocation protein [Ascodesmis nigricans]|uniref:Translocation protein SEC62 n=1 Tax=Ascodesmis nigricans TaxID=341454 RepID=A0A4S2N338_9PEZI|nr:translocation protein [Ascodesmis nigricans]
MQQLPNNPTPPPEAIAVANFLKAADLKCRTCIVGGQRKDMFKVKRALRALQSPAYQTAHRKNPLLPEVTDLHSAAIAFSLLPRSLLALRVTKIEPSTAEERKKRIKGIWNVKVEPQQEIREDLYYAFFYEPRTWTQILTALGVVGALLTLVMFPLWPPIMRLWVWYLSMGMLGLIGLFFVMSIFRLILFLVTVVAVPPGLWLYPNLFEDVGFFDSFRPVWAWHKVKGQKKKKAAAAPAAPGIAAPAAPPAPAAIVEKRPAQKASVEDANE